MADIQIVKQSDFDAHLASNAIDAHATIPTARVYNTSNQSIATGADTALAFTAERFNVNGIHNNSANNSRLTCKTAGVYYIWGCAMFDGSSTGFRDLKIKINGIVNSGERRSNLNTDPIYMNVGLLAQLNVNDYVELFAYQNCGSALNVLYAGNFSPEFGMVKVG